LKTKILNSISYLITVLILALNIIAVAVTPLKAADFRFPAEFEKHSAVWIGWPTYENKAGLSTVPLQLNMIRELVLHVTVKIAVQDEKEEKEVKNIIKNKGVSLDNIRFYRGYPMQMSGFGTWGPIFL
jgi:agmatine deiminase